MARRNRSQQKNCEQDSKSVDSGILLRTHRVLLARDVASEPLPPCATGHLHGQAVTSFRGLPRTARNRQYTTLFCDLGGMPPATWSKHRPALQPLSPDHFALTEKGNPETAPDGTDMSKR